VTINAIHVMDKILEAKWEMLLQRIRKRELLKWGLGAFEVFARGFAERK
jgi:hypothetical protein